MGNALTDAIGFTSSYDKAQDYRNLGQYTFANQQATQWYNDNLAAQQAQNTALGNTNYQQNAQDVYGQQQNAAGLLYNQATGKSASAADLQMQQGLANANNQSQSAMLSQQGGVSPGLSQRNMLNAQAAANAQIVGQGMVNRAQEQAQAQQAYAGQLGSMQSQQQNLGQFQYAQGQNALQNASTMNLQRQQVNAANNAAVYDAQSATLGRKTQAAQAQAAALGNTLGAAATLAL